MNEASFRKGFNFRIFEFKGYHLTDFTKNPVSRHYFGCIIKGRARIKTEDTVLELKEGEIFYIPKGLKYQSQWFGEEIAFYSFAFELSPVSGAFRLQKICASNKARELFTELCTQLPLGEKGIGLLYHFFCIAAEGMERAPKPHVNETVEAAVEFLRKNPSASVGDMARHCNMSESGIYSLFRRVLNKTPNEVKNGIVCERAVLLLTTTNKSVQEISDILGFSSTSYFRKILKIHTGASPREIRKDSEF